VAKNIVLREDILKKKKEIYTLQLIDRKNLDLVMKLQEYVYKNLLNKQVLVKDTYDDLYEDLKGNGKIIGAFNKNNDLIAYRYITFPGNSPKNLGNDLGMTKEELESVVHLETTVVHPSYRGNDLQSITLNESLGIISDMGFYNLLCTVSPQNFFSLYNIMKNGLAIKSLKKKYGTSPDGRDGVWRFILHRDLNIIRNSDPIDFTKCKIESLPEQRSLIDLGYVGYELNKDERMVHYTQFNS